MAPQLPPPERSGSAFGSVLRALFAPWSFRRGAGEMSAVAAALVAVVLIAAAAGLSTFLSTWTYLVAKGLVLGGREMDMGMDDLPIDTARQVAGSFATSIGVWVALLALVLVVAIAVADLLYRGDRAAFHTAARRSCALTIWFVVWAAAVIAANAVHHREIRHPAGAIRAYAQLNQHWFRGSSAYDPGPIEQEPLVARGRFRALVVLFPLIWSLALPLSHGALRLRRPALMGVAIVIFWAAWWGVWRLLPWVALETLAG